MKFADSIEELSSPEPNTGCTLWLGTIASGYARLKRDGKPLSVARLVLDLDDDSPLHALHTCDNSWCVARHHLYAGTHRQNMRDAIARGRSGLLRGGPVLLELIRAQPRGPGGKFTAVQPRSTLNGERR